jgi:transcriptional regulator
MTGFQSPIEATMDYYATQRERRELQRALARRKRTMQRLRERGWTLQRIADRFGLTRQRVGSILKG